MLATKGVNNAQYLHPINEDTDFEKYEFQDGELPRMESN
jgi:hypothetical protein